MCPGSWEGHTFSGAYRDTMSRGGWESSAPRHGEGIQSSCRRVRSPALRHGFEHRIEVNVAQQDEAVLKEKTSLVPAFDPLVQVGVAHQSSPEKNASEPQIGGQGLDCVRRGVGRKAHHDRLFCLVHILFRPLQRSMRSSIENSLPRAACVWLD